MAGAGVRRRPGRAGVLARALAWAGATAPDRPRADPRAAATRLKQTPQKLAKPDPSLLPSSSVTLTHGQPLSPLSSPRLSLPRQPPAYQLTQPTPHAPLTRRLPTLFPKCAPPACSLASSLSQPPLSARPTLPPPRSSTRSTRPRASTSAGTFERRRREGCNGPGTPRAEDGQGTDRAQADRSWVGHLCRNAGFGIDLVSTAILTVTYGFGPVV